MKPNDVAFLCTLIFFVGLALVMVAHVSTTESIEADCRLLKQFRDGNKIFDCTERKP